MFSFEGEKLSVVGSPFWMAPEVLRDEPYNEKVRSSVAVDIRHYHKTCFLQDLSGHIIISLYSFPG